MLFWKERNTWLNQKFKEKMIPTKSRPSQMNQELMEHYNRETQDL